MNILEHIDKYQPQLSISELLLVMIARDTREMLVMARENQKYIEKIATAGVNTYETDIHGNVRD